MYVVDLQNKTLLYNTYVAHVINTKEGYASSFSNFSGSLKSSLGFYITKNQTIGPKVGLSLIIRGGVRKDSMIMQSVVRSLYTVLLMQLQNL